MKYMQVQVGDFQKTEVTQVGYPAPAIHTTTTLLTTLVTLRIPLILFLCVSYWCRDGSQMLSMLSEWHPKCHDIGGEYSYRQRL